MAPKLELLLPPGTDREEVLADLLGTVRGNRQLLSEQAPIIASAARDAKAAMAIAGRCERELDSTKGHVLRLLGAIGEPPDRESAIRMQRESQTGQYTPAEIAERVKAKEMGTGALGDIARLQVQMLSVLRWVKIATAATTISGVATVAILKLLGG